MEMFHPMITSFLVVVVEVPVIQPLEKGFGGKQRRVIRAHEVVHVLLLFCCYHYSCCFLSLRIRLLLLLWRCIIFDKSGAHFGENTNWRTSSSSQQQQQLCCAFVVSRVLLKVRVSLVSSVVEPRAWKKTISLSSQRACVLLFSRYVCGIFAISKSKRREDPDYFKNPIIREKILSRFFSLSVILRTTTLYTKAFYYE